MNAFSKIRGVDMERKIDKKLSSILPNGLPNYPGLPSRWYLYPYGLVTFLFTVPISIFYIAYKAMMEYSDKSINVPIISSAYLLVLSVLFYFVVRANYRYWFTSLPSPHTFDEFVAFAQVVKEKGNNSQLILINDYILNTFSNENVSAVEVDLGIAYLKSAEYEFRNEDLENMNVEKGIKHLKKGLKAKDHQVRMLALETLRDYYLSIEEKESFEKMEDALRKMKMEFGNVG
jgi:hypothetical protein